MTRSTFDDYRRLLDDLHASIDARVRSEHELAALAAEPDEIPAHAFEEQLRSLTGEIEREIAEVDARYAQERQQFTRRHESAIHAAEAEASRVIGEVHQRIDAELEAVEQQYSENTWMLSSLLDDDAENSPKRQFEGLNVQLQQARDHLSSRWDDLKQRYARAETLLESRRQQTDVMVQAAVASKTRKEALERFEVAERAVLNGVAALERQRISRLFAGWSFVGLGLALWGGVFAGVYLAIDPQVFGAENVTPAGQVLLSGGVGFAVTALSLLALWGLASAQSSRAFRPVRQGMSDAQAQYQAWLRLAKEELQRSEKQYRERYAALVERRDRSFERFAAERDQRKATLAAELEEVTRSAEARREELQQESSAQLSRDLLVSETSHRRETTTLRTRLEREKANLIGQREQRRAERQVHRDALWNETASRWTAALQRLRNAQEAACRESRRRFPNWPELLADDWTPADTIPDGLRIGDFLLDLQQIPQGLPDDARLVPESSIVRLPAVLPFPDPPSLVIKADGEGRAAATPILQVAMLRLLTLLPPGKVRFTVIDPVGLGEQFSAFMHLADYDELLISGRIWTESARIEQQLGDLTEHMENVFQKYLRNEFETIEEYNRHAGEVAEPYRVLVVANFPHGFSERAAQRLTSIATSGRRCGVFALVGIDTKPPLPRGFDPENLESGATVLQWQNGRFLAGPVGPDRLVFDADAPPAPSEFTAIVRRIGELSKDVRRVEVPFHRVAPPPDRYWAADSRRSIDCPLGRAGATRLQHLRLGSGTSQHVLVAGKTGSGKSTLLHVLVTNLALRYAPSDVEFYLIDFKKGVEFKAYATHQLPHARVIAIESDREFGVSVLERLDVILKTRGDRFREVGVQDVAAFRDACPDEPMPRILLVVDEFQEFFTEDDRYSQAASLLLDRLVRQGRAFGIHVLLGSQTLGGAYSLARATIGQMAVRIALQCSDADASLILSEDNAAARLLTRPGEAIYNDANGMVDGNSPFQVAWLGDDERDACLVRMRELASQRGLSAAPPVVFEGNVPADPSQNGDLVARLESLRAEPPEPQSKEPPLRVPSAWLGEAVAITGPTEVAFPAQAGANLLLVGQDPAAARGITAACLLALSAMPGGSDDSTLSFHFLSGSRDDRWQALLEELPQPLTVVAPEQAGPVIRDLAAELARRKENPGDTPSPIFLVIDDLSRFRDLRRSDDDFGFGGFDRDREPSAAQRFAELLKEGPALGIHAIVWCDSYGNADRWLGRALIREFEMRVVFQMSATDSSHLLDSPAASRLGTNRALLYRDERGTTEKFRPYGPPGEEWLNQVRQYIHGSPPSSEEPSSDLSDDLDIDEWIIV